MTQSDRKGVLFKLPKLTRDNIAELAVRWKTNRTDVIVILVQQAVALTSFLPEKVTPVSVASGGRDYNAADKITVKRGKGKGASATIRKVTPAVVMPLREPILKPSGKL